MAMNKICFKNRCFDQLIINTVRIPMSFLRFLDKKVPLWIVAFMGGMLLLSSCNTTKYLKQDEFLLKKNNIEIKTSVDARETGDLNEQLYYVSKPKPNGSFIGIAQPRLWAYYKAERHINNRSRLDTATQQMVRDTSGFFKSIMGRFAEKPSIYDAEKTAAAAQSMTYYLNNKGFYGAKVTTEVTTKKRKATVTYIVETEDIMRISKVNYVSEDENIKSILPLLKQNSLLKANTPLESTVFSNEKARIVGVLKNQGYRYFFPNYVVYEGDSSGQNTNINVIILPPTDSSFHQKYYIGDTYIHTAYFPGQSIHMQFDTVDYQGYHFIKEKDQPFFIKKETLFNALFLKKGSLYKLEDKDRTNLRLGKLSVYKFVSIKSNILEKADSTEKNYLGYDIYLTPSKKMSIVFNGGLNYIIGDQYIGTNVMGFYLSADVNNRNIFKGAELLSFNIRYGLEAPVVFGNGQGIEFKSSVSRDFRVQTDLAFPPFSNNANMRISAGYNSIHRINLYDNTTVSLALGVDWQPTKSKSFNFNPISLNYLTNNLDSNFLELIGDDPRYASQWVLGGTYILKYSKQNSHAKSSSSFRLNIDLSGNVLNMIDQAILPNQPFSFGKENITYSQYAIFVADARYNKTLNRSLKVAARFSTGIGFSYLNSANSGLPYVKQLYISGTDIRGWRERQLGPGGFPGDQIADIQPYYAGDFKTVANAELRFGLKALMSGLEGAFFVDSGNVWLLAGDSPTDVRVLRSDNFLNRIAVSSGLGLRWDLSFAMLRIDYSYKIRRSYGVTDIDGNEPLSSYWVYFNGNNSFNWKDGNINLGIGYPF